MARKKRIQTPPHYNNYRKYKPYLRKEFDHRCAYCLVTEGELGGAKSFHIDHYRPQRKFPSQATTYTNLFYACRDCNAYKGSYWPNLLQNFLVMFIINPCDHDPEKHLNRSTECWQDLSFTGKWNIDKLRLNSPAKIKRRQHRDTLFILADTLEKQRAVAEEKASHCNLPQDKNRQEELIKTVDMIDQQLDALIIKLEVCCDT